MRKINNKYVDSLINKVLNETLEERADELTGRIKSNVNELGGMDSEHPKFGKKNFSKMSPEEIEDMMNNYIDDESDENDWTEIDTEDNHDKNWVHPLGEDEMEEGFDDPFIKKVRGGSDFSRKEFRDIPRGSSIDMKNYRDDSITPSKYFGNKLKDVDDLFRKHFGDDDDDDFNLNYDGDDDGDLMFEMEQEACEQCGGQLSEGECTECGMSYNSMNEEDYMMEQEACEQCGGKLYEGECTECGTSYNMEEGIHDVEDLDDENEFDYVEEESETGTKDYSLKGESNPEGCKAIMDTIRKYGETEVERDALERYKCDEVKGLSKSSRNEFNESLKGRQRVLDKDKNGVLNKKDFELLRKGKKSKTEKEVEEGNEFTGELAKAKKEGKSSFSVDGKKYPVKESVQLTEDELVDLIETIIKEEQKLKTIGGEPKGLTKYKQIHDKDGKENDEYLRSVATKMKEYLKDGSKGEYDENPKHFPKGNGQLEKMKAKKYTMSDDGKEFIDDYMRPGMENLDYDEVHPNEEWMTKNIEGSSETGNNPKWVNAEETDLGEKINKKRKANKFAKAKRQAYNKAPQPVVSDKSGDEKGTGIQIKESDSKQTKVLNEEFNKIQRLMSYDRKTQ